MNLPDLRLVQGLPPWIQYCWLLSLRPSRGRAIFPVFEYWSSSAVVLRSLVTSPGPYRSYYRTCIEEWGTPLYFDHLKVLDRAAHHSRASIYPLALSWRTYSGEWLADRNPHRLVQTHTAINRPSYIYGYGRGFQEGFIVEHTLEAPKFERACSGMVFMIELVELTQSISQLSQIQDLELWHCSNLSRLPGSLGN